MLVDSHCHLNFSQLQADLLNFLSAMKQNQVLFALCVSTNLKNIEEVVNLANLYPNLFASVGVHPDEDLTPEDEKYLIKDFLLKYIANHKVVAIGETGLDYYQTTVNKSIQHERFILQIEVAKISELPLIIHTRNSVEDTLTLIKDNNAMSVGGVMHCFTESLEYAKKFLDLGFYISISGIVTFKNAKLVQQVASYVPIDRLLIETDSPFLAPEPYRGKLNHPALLKYTAQYIADLRQIKLEDLGVATTSNFFKLFKRANIVASQARS